MKTWTETPPLRLYDGPQEVQAQLRRQAALAFNALEMRGVGRSTSVST